jgi:ABC-type branched-subunit amino acid transport system substrate-binding protein
MVTPFALRGAKRPAIPGPPGAFAAASERLGRKHRRRVAVMVPMSGSAGIWGPSCISCAELAIDEINRADGIRGQEIEPLFIDADDSAVDGVLEAMDEAIDTGEVDAIVGMHVSSVRQRLNAIVAGRIPYIYTPLYEGGERSPSVFTIGETPREQLEPALRRMVELCKVKRWALIGNDYIWPRVSNAHARACLKEAGGEVVLEEYVPFGLEEPYELVERVAEARPDIVLLSLIGQEAVEFNRVFGAMSLDRSMIRFSTAIEENILLATGSENTRRLYCASSYFSSLKTERNLAFKERYLGLHGERAPVLNALGQSIYEGMQFYASLARVPRNAPGAPVSFSSARGGRFYSNERKDSPIFLARADGHLFSVLERLG